jgi:hypothetical protein
MVQGRSESAAPVARELAPPTGASTPSTSKLASTTPRSASTSRSTVPPSPRLWTQTQRDTVAHPPSEKARVRGANVARFDIEVRSSGFSSLIGNRVLTLPAQIRRPRLSGCIRLSIATARPPRVLRSPAPTLPFLRLRLLRPLGIAHAPSILLSLPHSFHQR